MSGALTPALAAMGPLHWMADAIQARLREIFPPAYFQGAWMPTRPDRQWFTRTVQRTPAWALSWTGSPAESDQGNIFKARAHFVVALIVKNSTGVTQRFFGDKAGPGLFAMQRAVVTGLHGMVIDPPGVEWSATGTVEVTAVGNLYNDEWGDQDAAIVGVDLQVLYEEFPPLDLQAQLSPSFWELNFGMTSSGGAASEMGGA